MGFKVKVTGNFSNGGLLIVGLLSKIICLYMYFMSYVCCYNNSNGTLKYVLIDCRMKECAQRRSLLEKSTGLTLNFLNISLMPKLLYQR